MAPITVATPFPKLDKVKQQIRLLRVSTEDILEWVIYDLHQTPDFYTLSYAWDEVTDIAGTPSVHIQYNDKSWTRPVQYNLWTFIKHAKSWPPEVTYIWIDSLCIDQDNLEELNHQVGFMHKIYASCTEVLVWLGEPHPRRAKHWTHIGSGQPLKSWLHTLKTGSETEKYVFDSIVKDLMTRNYWSRMWTVQEFVIPPFVRICIGSHSLSLNDLLDLLCSYGTSHQGIDFWKWHECTLEDSHGISLTKTFNSMCERRSSHWWNPESEKALDTRSVWEQTFTSIAPSRRCTNPHDYIYAILGMCMESPIIPDYKSPLVEVLIYILYNVDLRYPIQTGQIIYQLFDLSIPMLKVRHRHESTSLLYSSPKMWQCPLVPLGDFAVVKGDDGLTYFPITNERMNLITFGNCDYDPHLTELFKIAETYIGVILRWYFPKGREDQPRAQILVGYFSSEHDGFEACQPFLKAMEQAFLYSTVRIKDDKRELPRLQEEIEGIQLDIWTTLDAFAFILDMSEFTCRRFAGNEQEWLRHKLARFSTDVSGLRRGEDGNGTDIVLHHPPHFVREAGCPCEFGGVKGDHQQPLSETNEKYGGFGKYLSSNNNHPPWWWWQTTL